MTLAEYLDSTGMKQRDFARLIGRTDAAVSNIVRGRYLPDRDTMRAIVQATGGQVMPNDFYNLGESASG